MKKFQVSFYYDVRATTVVEASDEDEAVKKLYAVLEDGGIEALEDEYRTHDREYDAMFAKEIE